ncbi:MAG: nucleotide sugar dehydrogenase [Candidatus Azotimanducaceae bacterium]|jgi:nucleotide sugar dehydrogenase
MVESTSPTSGLSYALPAHSSDADAIQKFVERNNSNPVVAVQGLGFVGAVMSLVVANAPEVRYAVIGLDLATPSSYWKIAGINGGDFPVVSSDPKIQEFYKTTIQNQNLFATHDPAAYSYADTIIVDMNLDVKKHHGDNAELEGFDVDLTNFTKGIQAIADQCKEDALILVESTVPPGTCAKLILPILQETFERRGLSPNFKLGHSYERVTPGPNYIDSVRSFFRVYSGIDDRSADAVETFLRTVIRTDEYPLTRLESTTATEMAKVLENSYRAMNIAFVQEWTEFAESSEVNLFEVIDAIRMRPTHANLMKPGLGVGGYCLTKDPLLASWAAKNYFGHSGLIQSEKAVFINDKMPLHTYERCRLHIGDFEHKKVLLLGVSYLNDVADTRSAPTELLYDKIMSDGAIVTLHDPYVPLWEERKIEVETDLNSLLNSEFDMVVLCTAHSQYNGNQDLNDFLLSNPNMIIVDTLGFFGSPLVSQLKANKNLVVIGRGDLK